MKNKAYYPALVLTLVCLVVGVVLAGVNSFTAPVIEENVLKAQNASLLEVMPDAVSFTKLDLTNVPATVKSVNEETSGKGYVIVMTTTSQYSSGDMGITVAITKDGVISAIKVTSYYESKNFGVETYPAKYEGLDASGVPMVENFSGASYSSTAFRNALSDAFTALTDNGLIAKVEKSEEQMLAETKLKALPGAADATGAMQLTAMNLTGTYVTEAYKANNDCGYLYVLTVGEDKLVCAVNAFGNAVCYSLQGANVTTNAAYADAIAEAKAASNALFGEDAYKDAVSALAGDASVEAASLNTYSTVVGAYVVNEGESFVLVTKTFGFGNGVLVSAYQLDSNGAIIGFNAITDLTISYPSSVTVEEYAAKMNGITADTLTDDITAISGATVSAVSYHGALTDVFAAYDEVKAAAGSENKTAVAALAGENAELKKVYTNVDGIVAAYEINGGEAYGFVVETKGFMEAIKSVFVLDNTGAVKAFTAMNDMVQSYTVNGYDAAAYGDKFVGLTEATLTDDVTAISGATVTAGAMNSALKAVFAAYAQATNPALAVSAPVVEVPADENAEMVQKVLGDGNTVEKLEADGIEGLKAAYTVNGGESYAFVTEVQGFMSPITTVIVLDNTGAIVKAEAQNDMVQSFTVAGYEADAYLAKLNGLTDATYTEDVTAISGATKTATAMNAAVKAAFDGYKAVNAATSAVAMDENMQMVAALLSAGDTIEAATLTTENEVKAAYVVNGGESYAFVSEVQGFMSPITTVIVLDKTGAIVKAQAQNDMVQSFTVAGYEAEAYLAKLNGVTEATMTDDVTAISGATKTAAAMNTAVKAAFAAYNGIAK